MTVDFSITDSIRIPISKSDNTVWSLTMNIKVGSNISDPVLEGWRNRDCKTRDQFINHVHAMSVYACFMSVSVSRQMRSGKTKLGKIVKLKIKLQKMNRELTPCIKIPGETRSQFAWDCCSNEANGRLIILFRVIINNDSESSSVLLCLH